MPTGLREQLSQGTACLGRLLRWWHDPSCICPSIKESDPGGLVRCSKQRDQLQPYIPMVRSDRSTVRRLTPAALAASSSDHSRAARAMRDCSGRRAGSSRPAEKEPQAWLPRGIT